LLPVGGDGDPGSLFPSTPSAIATPASNLRRVWRRNDS
jgi:hypothetical protein